jgi:hypothetical protein
MGSDRWKGLAQEVTTTKLRGSRVPVVRPLGDLALDLLPEETASLPLISAPPSGGEKVTGWLNADVGLPNLLGEVEDVEMTDGARGGDLGIDNEVHSLSMPSVGEDPHHDSLYHGGDPIARDQSSF